MPGRVINLGSLCIDHVYRVPRLALAGETVASRSYRRHAGGKGLNQSLAAARAGAPVRHAGCVGPDGGFLIRCLEAAGVDVSGIRVNESTPSGHAVIQVNDAGENAIVIHGGANRTLSAEDRQRAVGDAGSDDWLLLQNEINDLPAVLAEAGRSPAAVVFNAAPADGLAADLDLSGVRVLIVNRLEARALVPAATGAVDDVEVLRSLLAHHRLPEVVLTQGADGLLYGRPGGVEQLPAYEVETVDETAAGDAFIGYLVADLVAGCSMRQALMRASAAGALAVTKPGAADAIPQPAEVQALGRATPLRFTPVA